MGVFYSILSHIYTFFQIVAGGIPIYIFYITLISKKIKIYTETKKHIYSGEIFTIFLENKTLSPILIKNVYLLFKYDLCIKMSTKDILKISPWDIEKISSIQYTSLKYKTVTLFPQNSKCEVLIETSTGLYNMNKISWVKSNIDITKFKYLKPFQVFQYPGGLINQDVLGSVTINNTGETYYIVEREGILDSRGNTCKKYKISKEDLSDEKWHLKVQEIFGEEISVTITPLYQKTTNIQYTMYHEKAKDIC